MEDITLMVSELVAGGVMHGRAGTDDPVVLDVVVNGGVRCRVLDHGSGFAKRINGGSPSQWRGWGLRVIEQLSDRWGMQCSPDRTEVWFERQCA